MQLKRQDVSSTTRCVVHKTSVIGTDGTPGHPVGILKGSRQAEHYRIYFGIRVRRRDAVGELKEFAGAEG